MKALCAVLLMSLSLTTVAHADDMKDLPIDNSPTASSVSTAKKASSSASSNGDFVAVDKDEAQLIVRAISDAVSPYSGVSCIDSDKATSNYEMSAIVSTIRDVTSVLRKLGSQPVLKLVRSGSTDKQKSLIFITTDSSGRSVAQIEFRNVTEKDGVVTNVGTIAEPHYIKKAQAPDVYSVKCILNK